MTVRDQSRCLGICQLIADIFQDIVTWKDSYYAKMDMTNGFSQMLLAEKDWWKTTFTTPHGLYQYKVLPMGARNSPGQFQGENSRILAKAQALGKCLQVKIYIDDIFVGGKRRRGARCVPQTWPHHEFRKIWVRIDTSYVFGLHHLRHLSQFHIFNIRYNQRRSEFTQTTRRWYTSFQNPSRVSQ